MGKSKQEIADEFGREIFKLPWSRLNLDQQFFVFKHMCQWDKYRNAITRKAKLIITAKKIRGDQYNTIREWYYSRIPLSDVFQAMEKMRDFKASRGEAITSIKYFKSAVRAKFKQRQRFCDNRWYEYGSEFPEYGFAGRQDKFMYTVYMRWKEGYLENDFFDYFEGPNNHGNGEKRG